MSDMNKVDHMNKAAPRNSRMLQLEAALREAGFTTTGGLDRLMVAHLEGGPDVIVTPISAGNGRPAEVRAARVLVEHEPPEGIPVLIARRFTPGALEVLEEAGLSYVDERRFVFRSREPYILVDRMRSGTGTGGVGPLQVRLGGQVGVVVQVMLLGQEHGWRVTEVAEVGGVSVGTAQNAFRRLEELNVVRTDGSGPLKRRWLTDRGRLLDLWASQARAERATLITTFVFSQSPDDLTRRVSQALTSGSIEHAVTGACAARLVAPHVTGAAVCEVWVSAGTSAETVLVSFGAKAETKGANLRVLRGRGDAALFRSHPVGDVTVANDLRLYSDLLADPKRGEEQAAFLREVRLGY
jgi:Transcriptional regulator, AbiEi antitoxin, Type IV TA system